MAVTMDQVKQLREETGAGIMDAKHALEEANGDLDRARQLVKERGFTKAEKKADRETNEGFVGVYVHTNGKLAAMVTLLCETDFVARNDEFRTLAKELAMQVASMEPANVEELYEQEYYPRRSQYSRHGEGSFRKGRGEYYWSASFVCCGSRFGNILPRRKFFLHPNQKA